MWILNLNVRRLTFYPLLVWMLISLLNSSAVSAQEHLTLAVHPYITAKQIVDKFTPLADYLSQELGKTVHIKIAKNYTSHIDTIEHNWVDIAYMGPSSYVELSKRQAHPLLARLEIKGKPTFRGALIVADSMRFKTLEDLKGKRFAFGSPHSTMSHLVPRYVLHHAGLADDVKQQHTFLGNHDNVALGVLMGEFDVGAVKEAVYEKYQDRGLNLLQWTPEISEHVFVASNTLPEAEIEKIRHAMFNLSSLPEGVLILQSIKKTISALVPVKAEDYDNLREILYSLKKVGIPD